MIRIKNLTKDYGRNKGVFDLSFEVANGEVFGLLGPEGAGKTTVMRLLMGFVRPSSGRCFIHGKNCSRQAEDVKIFTGYMPQACVLPADMTGISFLRFMAQMHGVKSLERAIKLSDRFGLDTDLRIGRMADEERRKLQIVCAWMHDPEVLLLDEPACSLDKPARMRLWELLQEEKKRGKTILLASPFYEEIDRVCDRVGILQKGMLVNVDDITGMRTAGRKRFQAVFASEQEAVRFVRRESFEVQEMDGTRLTIVLSGSLSALLGALGNYEVLEFEHMPLELEEIFTHVYGGGFHA